MAVEVDERSMFHHSPSETNVVWVTWVRSAIAIVNSLIGRLIFVRPFLARNFWNSRDAQRQVANCRLKYALRTHQRDAASVELESLLKDTSGKNRPAMKSGLLCQEVEGRNPYDSIEVGSHWPES